MLAPDAVKQSEDDYLEHLRREGEISTRFLRTNALINQAFRAVLLLGAVVFIGTTFWYVVTHADPMANVLLGRTESDDGYWQALGAVLFPVGVLILFAGAMVLLSLHVQSRGVSEFERLMSGVSRIRRDATGVARNRTTRLILEDSNQHTRSAFLLQLWMGRSLFLSSLVLVLGFAIYSLIAREFDGVSVSLAAGSILSYFVGWITNSADRIGDAVADTTQLQLVMMSTGERLSVASEYGFQLMEASAQDPAEAADRIKAVLAELKAISADAVTQVQDFAEPRAFVKPS